jgi:potassium-transporting ATPase KdpC subunit
MRRQLVAAVRMLVVLTILTGVVYPLVVTAVAQTTMPARADGSLVRVDGRVVGSSLLGQAFTGPQWFHPRPGSYDPTASGPTNLGPTNPKLIAAARIRIASIGNDGAVPADAVTSSASGLDPDISPAYASLQVSRVAAARGMPASAVLALVERMTAGRTFGVLGEPRVNVLLLNLGLARLASGP